MELIHINQKEQWNSIVKSFPNWDIYYLNEYAESFQIHGDGEPILVYVSLEEKRMAYVMMQNDISNFKPFQNALQANKYYDWTSPYGYGGPLYDGNITDEWMDRAMKEIEKYANMHGVVSQFFRFHPLLQNQKRMESVSKVLYMKKSVFVDTTSEDLIMKNMTPNNRNMVRKARKNGVKIMIDQGEHLDAFIEIYNNTMQEHHAEEYYFFEREYFDYIKESMQGNIVFFYALYEEKIISASIFFYNEQFMHYHLSGTLPEYRGVAAANLLLTEAADWAAKHGINKLHLGGGVENEDSLLRFKKHFNRNGLIDFCIGCNIFMKENFEMLVQLRKTVDASFDTERPYMIQYRG